MNGEASMNMHARYRPYNLRWFNRVLRWCFGSYLRLFFRIKPIGTELFNGIKGPFVLIPNHQGILDPFMVGSYVPRPVYWVTSDGNMRSNLLKFLLRLVGSIPKSKVIPDLETVNWIVEVIRKRGGVVGIFAEGQASWDGHTLPLIPSTAKLLKLLKVPVVTAQLRGAYYSQPRWSWNQRRGIIEIEFSLLMDGAELKAASAEGILERLKAAMEYDEAQWLAEQALAFRSGRRARHLELALFLCPSCQSVATMRSFRNRFYCQNCGMVNRLGPDYLFKRVGSSEARFSTIREWNLWQESAYPALVRAAARNASKPIISDTGVMLFKGRKMNPLRLLRTGVMALYADRITLHTLSGTELSFPLADIEGAGVLKQQLFEFYFGKGLYQFRFPARNQSARKWLLAVQALKAAD
ncbi:MAG TPA: hypothetical protein DCG47_01120 [Spirochaetaceae bacterium]|jgi:1-acyl-sn-glycerol-3-phosphate acyltransferase|nr:hypothetical protein [Spirochaetaceae bacterium]